MKTPPWRAALALAPLWVPMQASAVDVVTHGTWAGVDVTITTPDKVTFNTAFQVSFLVDAGTLGAGDPVAFLSRLSMDNTVGLGAATWSYQFASDALAAPLTRNGALGDSWALLSPAGAGRTSIQLVDPVAWDGTFNPDGFTFLSGEFRDSVRWTLSNLIISADFTLGLTLDDGGIIGAQSFNANVVVLDPPAPVPEPGQWALLLGGLGLLAWYRHRTALPAAQASHRPAGGMPTA